MSDTETQCENLTNQVLKARTPEQIEAVKVLIWEFFDVLRLRYPEMVGEIDAYIHDQDVVGQLENFGDVFQPPNGECFVAYAGTDPAGLVLLKPEGERAGEMNRMYVRDSARGLGLGRKLGEALIEEARALNYKTVRLDALHRHVEALPLYESLGFRRYEDAGAVGGTDARFIHMKLTL